MPKRPDAGAIVEQVTARLKQIEDQFRQHRRVAEELERLREVVKDLERVVSRLGGGGARSATPTAPARPTARAKPSRTRAAAAAKRPKPSRARSGAAAPARTPRGQNKTKILEALKGRGPMTASEIAEVTGIPAATVSTALTRMAKAGELAKAERGYTLPR